MTLFAIVSCQKDEQPIISSIRNITPNNGQIKFSSSMMRMTSAGPFSQFIPIDSANKMVNSYLTSINYPANDSDLQALIFDANVLRNYLNDSSHGKIVQIKIMLGHTLEYINSGHFGMNAKYQTGELTVIIAGYDQNNNYIYNSDNMVLDHAMPCPDWCPTGGTAQYSSLR